MQQCSPLTTHTHIPGCTSDGRALGVTAAIHVLLPELRSTYCYPATSWCCLKTQLRAGSNCSPIVLTVGYALQISASTSPSRRLKADTMSQPHTMLTGPPYWYRNR